MKGYVFRLYRLLREKFYVPYPRDKIKQLKKLHPGYLGEQLEEMYGCQRFAGMLFVLAATGIIVAGALAAGSHPGLLQKGSFFLREEPGGGGRQTEIEVNGGSYKEEFTVTIPEREYTREELEDKMAQAKEYVLGHYLGQNTSEQKITQPLVLISQIRDSPIKVTWKTDSGGYVNKDGSLNNRDLEGSVETSITAVLIYGDTKEKIPLDLMIYPGVKSKKDQFLDAWNKALAQEQENSAQGERLTLPEKVMGISVTYREVSHSVWWKLLLGGLVLCCLIPVLLDYQTEQEIKKRDMQLAREYPEVVERFILLLGAGLTIRGAWFRITQDYEKRRKNREVPYHYLYEEMVLTRNELENGQSEAEAYTDFGRRLSLLQYMKFSTLLVQNLKKGSDDLLKRMEMEAEDALRLRRELAKKSGEEAGTKLLFPMMMMLAIVFALIMLAAFQTM
jgi:hypothetical protein